MNLAKASEDEKNKLGKKLINDVRGVISETEEIGNYGPYKQSERKEIYHAYIKKLIEIGRAYPCFCTKEELEELRKNQEEKKMRTGYYGRYARCNTLSVEEAINKIKNKEPYVIRFFRVFI